MIHYIATCVSVIIVFTRSSLGYTDTSSGSGSGVICGGHICAEYASCSVNDICICNHPIYSGGNGYLKCYPQTYIGAFLLNDPLLSTYDNEHANLALPCRYQFTEVDTNLLDRNSSVAGSCSIKVRGFNRKHRGKIYVHGVDVAFFVIFNNGSNFKMSVRKFGVAENGVYNYQVNASEGVINVDGPFMDDDIVLNDWVTGLNIVECYIDKENNVAIINITHCGVCIYFRPYDIQLRRNQTQIPGFAVGIDTSHSPYFDGHDLPVALTPSTMAHTVSFKDLPLQVSNNVDIIHRALSFTIPQNNPYPNTGCENATEATNAFNGVSVLLAKAYNRCTWMLLSPKLIRCYDETETGERIMELFTTCLHIQTGETSCVHVQALISSSGCEAHDPTNGSLNSFMSSFICEVP